MSDTVIYYPRKIPCKEAIQKNFEFFFTPLHPKTFLKDSIEFEMPLPVTIPERKHVEKYELIQQNQGVESFFEKFQNRGLDRG